MVAEIKKPKVENVSIDALKRDYHLYPRSTVDYLTVGRFIEAMKAGAKFPPIRVDAKTARIIDGFHRYAAYSEMRVQMVDVIAEEVKDDADFFMRAVEANKAHGLGYSGADHEKIVKTARLLQLDREKVAFAMAVPVQKFIDLQRTTPKNDNSDPVKVGTAHRSRAGHHRMDDPPTPDRERTSVPTGYLFFFNQVVKFLQSDGCDINNQEVLYKLRETQEALTRRLNPDGRSLTPLVLPEPVREYYIEWSGREKLPLVNHVIETLIEAAELDLDARHDTAELSKSEYDKQRKKFRPHSVLYKS